VIIYPPAIAGGTDCIQYRFLTFEAKLPDSVFGESHAMALS
jgi:hypothetical protein